MCVVVHVSVHVNTESRCKLSECKTNITMQAHTSAIADSSWLETVPYSAASAASPPG